MRRASLAFGLLTLAMAAHGQQQQPARFGASVSAYYISDSRLRDAFGNPALTYGVNASALSRPRANKPTFAYNVLTATKGDSKFFLVPFTIGYEKQLGDRLTAKTLPYARVEAGYAYYDVAIHDGSYNQSFKTGGFTAGAEAGIIFNRSLGLKARYNLFQDRFGVDLSGVQVGVTYNFFSL